MWMVLGLQDLTVVTVVVTVVVVHVVTDISNGYNFTNGNSISRYGQVAEVLN